MTGFITRKWIIAHVVVLAAVTTCVLAGRWQLRRLDERRAHSNLLEVRRAQSPVDEQALRTNTSSLAYRRVVVEGTYDAASQVLLPGRVLNGATGSEVLTPLRTDGVAVLVVRGWVPQQIYDPASPPPSPPAGRVRVSGVLVPSAERGRFGPTVSPTGTLLSMPRLDIPRIAKQVPYPLAALAVRLGSADPAPAAGQPLPSPLPPLAEGPHLSYAIQWFLFAAVFVAGYIMLIRRAHP